MMQGKTWSFRYEAYGQLTAVQRGIPDAVDTLIREQFQGHEIAAGGGDDYLGCIDSHVRFKRVDRHRS